MIGNFTGLGIMPSPFSRSAIIGVTVEKIPLDNATFFRQLKEGEKIRYAMNVAALLERTVMYSPFEPRAIRFDEVGKTAIGAQANAIASCGGAFSSDDLAIFLRGTFEQYEQVMNLFTATHRNILLVDSGETFLIEWHGPETGRNSWYFQLAPDGIQSLNRGDRMFSPQRTHAQAVAA